MTPGPPRQPRKIRPASRVAAAAPASVPAPAVPVPAASAAASSPALHSVSSPSTLLGGKETDTSFFSFGAPSPVKANIQRLPRHFNDEVPGDTGQPVSRKRFPSPHCDGLHPAPLANSRIFADASRVVVIPKSSSRPAPAAKLPCLLTRTAR